MSNFSENLKQLRVEKNMTQEDLAKKINVSKSTVSLYEKNAREPNISILISLSKLFDVSTDYLLGLTDIRHTAIDKKFVDDLVLKVIEVMNNNNL